MLTIELNVFFSYPIWKVHNKFSIILSSVDKYVVTFMFIENINVCVS